MERYKRSVRGGAGETDKVNFKVKLLRQIIVCAVIFVSVFIISLLKTDTATKLTKHISNTLSYTVDYKATVMDMVDKITGMTKGE